MVVKGYSEDRHEGRYFAGCGGTRSISWFPMNELVPAIILAFFVSLLLVFIFTLPPNFLFGIPLVRQLIMESLFPLLLFYTLEFSSKPDRLALPSELPPCARLSPGLPHPLYASFVLPIPGPTCGHSRL